MPLAFLPAIVKKRQKEFFNRLPDNSVAIVFSPLPVIRSNDVEYRFRPSSHVLYLTGIKDPGVCIIFSKKRLKDGLEQKSILFRRKLNYEEKVWIGEETPDDELKKVVDEICTNDDFETYLEKLADKTDFIFYQIGENKDFDLKITGTFAKLKKKMRSGSVPPLSVRDIDTILGPMRARKDEYEIGLIKKAVSITKLAIKAVEDIIRPGFFEYEIEAEILKTYKKFGGCEAFPTIVASGKNSVILHYSKNDSPLSIPCIIDTGAEFDFYSADITRTFISEHFSSDWKLKNKIRIMNEVKRAVEEVQQKVISEIKEGVSFHYLNELAQKLITSKLIEMGLLQGSVDENLEKKRFRVFFPHKIGHHIGLDVHDVSPYFLSNGDPIPLQENAVITVEPGIYIPNLEYVFIKDGKIYESKDLKVEDGYEEIRIPEDFRGIGIRIEDDVIVKKNGREVISSDSQFS